MLNSKQKQILKGQAHGLKPVVLMGNHGLTEAVLKEIDLALKAHELIKVRIQADDRDEKNMIVSQICQNNQAELVQLIGNICVLYRENPEKN